MTRNALAPYLTDMGGYDPEQVPAQYMQPELRAYRPTWRDTLASWLMPDERASPEQSRLVEGLAGSRGLGNTGMGIVDFVPAVGNAFQAQEEGRKGEGANMMFAMVGGPAAKVPKPGPQLSTGNALSPPGIRPSQQLDDYIRQDLGFFSADAPQPPRPAVQPTTGPRPSLEDELRALLEAQRNQRR